jgi:hypothetical protein
MGPVAVSSGEVEQFDIAVALACAHRSEHRLEFDIPINAQPSEIGSAPNYFYSSDDCLVISFDGSWYPFLDNTRGYNGGPQRWYIPKVSSLLASIAHVMQTREQKRLSRGRTGGRIFVHAGGAIRRPASGREVEVLSWKLPKESYFLRDRRAKLSG